MISNLNPLINTDIVRICMYMHVISTANYSTGIYLHWAAEFNVNYGCI